MLEEENLYQKSAKTQDEIPPLKSDLMYDLDDKYRKLQGKYNHLGTYTTTDQLVKSISVNKIDKTTVKIPSKQPQYNDIFRRMFDVLSESIDKNKPVKELVNQTVNNRTSHENKQQITRGPTFASSDTDTISTTLSSSPEDELEITLPNSNQVMSGNVIGMTHNI